jgi:hypothetical protein
MLVLPQLHQEMVVLERYVNHSFHHVVSTLVLGWDWEDFKESLIVAGRPRSGDISHGSTWCGL